jgi:hypothetical protein
LGPPFWRFQATMSGSCCFQACGVMVPHDRSRGAAKPLSSWPGSERDKRNEQGPSALQEHTAVTQRPVTKTTTSVRVSLGFRPLTHWLTPPDTQFSLSQRRKHCGSPGKSGIFFFLSTELRKGSSPWGTVEGFAQEQ